MKREQFPQRSRYTLAKRKKIRCWPDSNNRCSLQRESKCLMYKSWFLKVLIRELFERTWNKVETYCLFVEYEL